LLSEAERSLLQRLSIFAGGWFWRPPKQLAAGGLQACDVLELLGS